jgi:hypothetical protein
MNRSSLVALVALLGLVASQARAQDISGTLSAKYSGTDAYGIPHVSFSVKLTCALVCPAGNPTLFGVAGFGAHLEASPKQPVGYLGTGMIWELKKTGVASGDGDGFPAGVNFIAEAGSVSCQCGGRDGQSGFIDILSAPVRIPPHVNVTLDPVQVGEVPYPYIVIMATPAPSETVEVRVSGAGIDKVFHFSSADFEVPSDGPAKQGTKMMSVAFTKPGMATITVSVGGGPPFTKTIQVVPLT